MKLEQLVALRIKEARTQKGITQEALGLQIGIDEATARTRINQYEHGKHTPPFSTLERIANVLGKSVLWFLCSEKDKAIVQSLEGISDAKRDELLSLIQG